MATLSSLIIGLLPVLVFLLFLILLDSYKLLRLGSVIWMLALGALAAQASLYINVASLRILDIDTVTMSRYVAPIVEEGLKGGVIVVLLYRNRIGFLVDAAIRGFAIGAGFAAVENVYYFLELADSRLVLWVLRGFGTAIMHGGVTAMMAVIAKHLIDLRGKANPLSWLPAMAFAIVLHSFFNHFILPPDQSAVLLLIMLPVVFAAVFRSSERSTRKWMGVGFDTDSELLESINSGNVSETRTGEYLTSIRQHFSPETLVDMICLIRIHLELSVKAKGLLLAREAGFDLPPDQSAKEQLEEMRYLENSIGRIGTVALKPIFNMSSRDLWQVYFLSD